jgi:hypothetical protein
VFSLFFLHPSCLSNCLTPRTVNTPSTRAAQAGWNHRKRERERGSAHAFPSRSRSLCARHAGPPGFPMRQKKRAQAISAASSVFNIHFALRPKAKTQPPQPLEAAGYGELFGCANTPRRLSALVKRFFTHLSTQTFGRQAARLFDHTPHWIRCLGLRSA